MFKLKENAHPPLPWETRFVVTTRDAMYLTTAVAPIEDLHPCD